MKIFSKSTFKCLWILLKVKIKTLFTNRVQVSFIKLGSNWYCDIPGWPTEYQQSTLMYGDALRMLNFLTQNNELELDVVFSNEPLHLSHYTVMSKKSSSLSGGGYYYCNNSYSCIWLSAVMLFVVGCYPEYIYFKKIG